VNGGIVVFLLASALFGEQVIGSREYIAGLYILLALPALHPAVVSRVGRVFPRRFSYMRQVTYSFRDVLRLQFVFLGYWLVLGLAFWLLLGGIIAGGLCNPGYLVGVLPGSWVAGFVSFLTPAGLGIREGFMAVLLKPCFHVSVGVTVSLAARLWWTFFDLLFALTAARLSAQQLRNTAEVGS